MSTDLAQLLTIVVPTSERPSLLARCLDYYADFPCTVVVADGSSQRFTGAHGAGNVDYVHMPGADPWQRMSEALSRVETPFCVASPDDDFLLRAALDSCVQALQQSPDCMTAQGIYAEYRVVDRQRIDVGLKYIPSYRHHLLMGDAPRSAVARVEALMERFVQCVWAVHRTADLAHVFRLGREGEPVPVLMVELLFGLTRALRGQSVLLPELYCLRDVAPSRYPYADKAHVHVLSRVAAKHAAYRRFLDLIANDAGPDLASIRADSKVCPHADSVSEWLDAVLRRWALRVMAPDPEPVPVPRRRTFTDAHSGLVGEFELPDLLGDVDTQPEALYPALRLVQRDYRPEDRFHVRFGVPRASRRSRLARALARRLGFAS